MPCEGPCTVEEKLHRPIMAALWSRGFVGGDSGHSHQLAPDRSIPVGKTQAYQRTIRSEYTLVEARPSSLVDVTGGHLPARGRARQKPPRVIINKTPVRPSLHRTGARLNLFLTQNRGAATPAAMAAQRGLASSQLFEPPDNALSSAPWQ